MEKNFFNGNEKRSYNVKVKYLKNEKQKFQNLNLDLKIEMPKILNFKSKRS